MRVYSELRSARRRPSCLASNVSSSLFSAHSVISALKSTRLFSANCKHPPSSMFTADRVSPLLATLTENSQKGAKSDLVTPFFSIKPFHSLCFFRTLAEISPLFAHTSQKGVGVHPLRRQNIGTGSKLEQDRWVQNRNEPV